MLASDSPFLLWLLPLRETKICTFIFSNVSEPDHLFLVFKE